jgi:hypothetical protein
MRFRLAWRGEKVVPCTRFPTALAHAITFIQGGKVAILALIGRQKKSRPVARSGPNKRGLAAVRQDLFDTPHRAMEYLEPHLPAGRLWDPCAGNGALAKWLESRGRDVVVSDKYPAPGYESAELNFLKCDQDAIEAAISDYDAIVTNPPFCLKTEFLERLYALGKPFCCLLPITALETPKRGALFARHGLSLHVVPERLRFTNNCRGPSFNTSWFCWGGPECAQSALTFPARV